MPAYEEFEDSRPWFRYFVYSVITLALILSWYGLPKFIKIAAIVYLVYRVLFMFAHSISCFTCQRKLALALMVVAFAYIQFPPQFYIAAILIVWANEAMEWAKKKSHKLSYNDI
ncbi:MAG: hypothetical protein OXR66_01505 [Candidatus Woesearchaeota archaeon]|nr:hypothetical protein [Candidatus Woesearchaeota archaeon]